MKKNLTIGLLLAAMLATGAWFAQTASADEGGMRHSAPWMNDDRPMRDEGHRMLREIMALDLNQKQRAEIGEIAFGTIKDLIRKKADERIASIELRELLSKDQVDMGAVEAKLKQVESLKTDIKLTFIKAVQEAKAKLTPEQRKKLKEMLRKTQMDHRECKMRGVASRPARIGQTEE